MECVRHRDEADSLKIVEPWGSLTWLVNKTFLGSNTLTVGRVVIKRGMSNPRHLHPNSEEILYLLKGKLQHSLGNEKVLLKEGDTLRIDAGVAHNAMSIGDVDADMIVVYPTPDRQFITE